jgi:hypothetical protein
MESALVCFVSIALMIVSVVTMTMNTVQSTAKLSNTWKAMEQQANITRRTEIASLAPEKYYGGIIELTVKNEGQVNINDFVHWDVFIEEQDSSTNYMAYSPNYPPESNQWAVKGIYVTNNIPEAFDLNILNPGEQVVIGINPGEGVNTGKTLKVTLSTSDGITSQSYVTVQDLPPSP